jgi:hypothetical protein
MLFSPPPHRQNLTFQCSIYTKHMHAPQTGVSREERRQVWVVRSEEIQTWRVSWNAGKGLCNAFRISILNTLVYVCVSSYHSNSWLVKVASNGRYLLAPTIYGQIFVFNLLSGQVSAILKDHEGKARRDEAWRSVTWRERDKSGKPVTVIWIAYWLF